MTSSRDRSVAQSTVKSDGRHPASMAGDPMNVDMDKLSDLSSFYIRSLNICLSKDLDRSMGALPVARGTGKISTLLLVGANPGIRPSTIARIILKDRSAMVRLLGQLKAAHILIQRVSKRERRAHELTLTKKGEALAERVRAIAIAQNERFFSVLTEKEESQLQSILKKLLAHHIDGVVGAP